MHADVLVVPEVEGEIHRFSVLLSEQWLDVSCKTGCVVLNCHLLRAFFNDDSRHLSLFLVCSYEGWKVTGSDLITKTIPVLTVMGTPSTR